MRAKGKVDQGIVDENLEQPYFQHNIPGTTGREILSESTSKEVCERMLSEGVRPEEYVAIPVTRIDYQRGCKLASTTSARSEVLYRMDG